MVLFLVIAFTFVHSFPFSLCRHSFVCVKYVQNNDPMRDHMLSSKWFFFSCFSFSVFITVSHHSHRHQKFRWNLTFFTVFVVRILMKILNSCRHKIFIIFWIELKSVFITKNSNDLNFQFTIEWHRHQYEQKYIYHMKPTQKIRDEKALLEKCSLKPCSNVQCSEI